MSYVPIITYVHVARPKGTGADWMQGVGVFRGVRKVGGGNSIEGWGWLGHEGEER